MESKMSKFEIKNFETDNWIGLSEAIGNRRFRDNPDAICWANDVTTS